jgi:hypothetical protein
VLSNDLPFLGAAANRRGRTLKEISVKPSSCAKNLQEISEGCTVRDGRLDEDDRIIGV